MVLRSLIVWGCPFFSLYLKVVSYSGLLNGSQRGTGKRQLRLPEDLSQVRPRRLKGFAHPMHLQGEWRKSPS